MGTESGSRPRISGDSLRWLAEHEESAWREYVRIGQEFTTGRVRAGDSEVVRAVTTHRNDVRCHAYNRWVQASIAYQAATEEYIGQTYSTVAEMRAAIEVAQSQNPDRQEGATAAPPDDDDGSGGVDRGTQ